MGQSFEIDSIFRQRPRILTESKSFEPLRNIDCHGASLRPAGFREVVKNVDHLIAKSGHDAIVQN
jgi:hypothetical protein